MSRKQQNPKRKRPPMVVETMTLLEAVDALRGLGISTSQEKVLRFLEAGVYPWGICVQGPKNRQVEIYAKKFWEWVDEIGEEDTEYIRTPTSA